MLQRFGEAVAEAVSRSMDNWVNEVLLTLREVFDYVEGLADDYGGRKVLFDGLELMVISIPVSFVNDYLDVIASLADDVIVCEGLPQTLYLYFTVDPDGESRIVVKAKLFYIYRGRAYIGFRALGLECTECGKQVRISCKPSNSDTST